MTPFNPDSWMDVFVLLTLAVIAAVPSWAALRNHKSLKEVSDSVNNRPTALRDDLDKAIAAIESLARDVRGIKADLWAEEDRRRRDVASLEDRIGRHRKQES